MSKFFNSYLSRFFLFIILIVFLQFVIFIVVHYLLDLAALSAILINICATLLILIFTFYSLRKNISRFLQRYKLITQGNEGSSLFTEEEYCLDCIKSLTQQLKILENHVELQKAIKQKYQADNIEIHLDSMTKLFTKEYLYKVAHIEISKALNMGIPISVLMIDVDNFKHYNDGKGHLMGDRVLIKLAKVLKSSIRAADIGVRYGGEEFLVFLPNSPQKYAIHVAQRIQEAIEREDFPEESFFPQGRLTVSIGIASIPTDCMDLTSLIEKADQALYQAKRLGKNTIHWKK